MDENPRFWPGLDAEARTENPEFGPAVPSWDSEKVGKEQSLSQKRAHGLEVRKAVLELLVTDDVRLFREETPAGARGTCGPDTRTPADGVKRQRARRCKAPKLRGPRRRGRRRRGHRSAQLGLWAGTFVTEDH